MKVGIIVYSQTGNTFQVAEDLEKRISGSGHAVKLDRIEVEGEPKPGEKKIKFENEPKVDPYDIIVFGAPVQAFSLCVVMKKYLSDIGSMKGKKVHLLTTKAISTKWSGGNGAINKMKKLSEAKGAVVGETGIIFWGKKHRMKMTKEVIDKISKAL
jgi:flavodoxin